MPSSVSDTLNKLRQQFADQLPKKLNSIRELFQRVDLSTWNTVQIEELHRQLHGLTGSAGTFGMQSISNAARFVENRLGVLLKTKTAPVEVEWISICADFDRLDKLARIRLESNAPSLRAPSVPSRLNHAPLIHLVEDDLQQAEHLSQALRDDGFRVEVFTRTDDFRFACSTVDTERPSAIVMDMIFPDGDDAGARLLNELKVNHGRCPPVIFASVRDDIAARLAAFRAGASRYLVKPVHSEQLISLLDELTGRQPPQPYRILMVDDDPSLLEAQATVLRAEGMEVRTLSEPLQILDVLNDFTPDVCVLDVYMPDASGPELAAVLRERDAQQYIPILFLSAETDITQQLLALNLGGDDFLVKPVQADHLVEAVTARARRARQNLGVRQRLEINLYEREREHLALNQHAIVSIADLAGKIIYVNDKFCEISCYSRDELIGQNHRLLKSGEHAQEFYQTMWHTISSGKVWQGEICNRRKDGSFYWVESTITPFLDGEGLPYQYVSIRTDITDMKESQGALRASEERLNQAQQVSHLGSFEWNTINGDLTWSDEHFRLWGFEPGSVTPSFELFRQPINSDDLIVLDQALQHAMETRETFDAIYRLKHADGCEFFLHSRGEFIFDDAGKAIKLSGTVQDITERKRAEQEAEASKERLRRGQLYANIGTWDWNIQTGDLHWTERIAPLFGYPTGELATTYDNFLAAIHSDDRQAVIDAVNNCVERDVPYVIEHRVVWPDGTVRWLLERGGVQRDKDGKPLQMLGVVQDIDGRKRAELALAEREQELRQAQTMAHIGNWSANMTTGELNWSDEIYRIFGYEPGSFAPSVNAFKAAIHPDDRKLVEESEKLAEQSGLHNVVHRIIRSDGTVRHVHELAQAERDENGIMIRLSGTVQDVTERIQTEARLQESQERFSFAVEGAGDGIWDWDILTGEMLLSGHYEEMLGFNKKELEPTIDAWIKTVHPDDLPSIQKKLKEYLAGQIDSYNVELRLRCKDGSYKWILCRGTIVAQDSGKQPIRMIGIHSDITERKLSEQALADRERFLKILIDNIPGMVGYWNKELRCSFANTGYLDWFEKSPEQMRGISMHELLGDKLFNQNEPYVRLALDGKIQRFELMLIKPDGSTSYTWTHYIPDLDRGQVHGFFVLVSDISEIKIAQVRLEELNNELKTARDESERANKAKSEFLSSMSHELRTPMNAILGFSQLMEYDETLPDEHKDNVLEILKAGNHLLTLINEVLDLAKVESGHIELSLEPVEVCAVIEECLSLVSTLAAKRSITISHSGLEDVYVRADRTRLRQVLLNLLSNAIKYNREGGRVKIEVQKEGINRLQILVTDTGTGIPKERLQELFLPFNRLDAEKTETEGTGIGLTITRRIVEMMGGTVDVRSEIGVGSMFWIDLPLESALTKAQEQNEHGNRSDKHKALATVNETARHTVLYIEDNPSNLRLVAQILGRRQNIHLLTAHTPELGIELALSRRPDLIMLDINMPGMDGYQVLTVFKADTSLQNIPVIAVTANAMPRDIERGMAAGFNDYLTKPLNLEKFHSVLDKYLSSETSKSQGNDA